MNTYNKHKERYERWNRRKVNMKTGKFVKIYAELTSKYIFYTVVSINLLDGIGSLIMQIFLLVLFFINLWGSLESVND